MSEPTGSMCRCGHEVRYHHDDEQGACAVVGCACEHLRSLPPPGETPPPTDPDFAREYGITREELDQRAADARAGQVLPHAEAMAALREVPPTLNPNETESSLRVGSPEDVEGALRALLAPSETAGLTAAFARAVLHNKLDARGRAFPWLAELFAAERAARARAEAVVIERNARIAELSAELDGQEAENAALRQRIGDVEEEMATVMADNAGYDRDLTAARQQLTALRTAATALCDLPRGALTPLWRRAVARLAAALSALTPAQPHQPPAPPETPDGR